MSQNQSYSNTLFQIPKRPRIDLISYKGVIFLYKNYQRFNQFRELVNKPPIKVNKFYEVLNFLQISRSNLINNYFHLLRIYLKVDTRYNNSQKYDFLYIKFTLLNIHLQTNLSKAGEDYTYMLSIFASTLTIDKNII